MAAQSWSEQRSPIGQFGCGTGFFARKEFQQLLSLWRCSLVVIARVGYLDRHRPRAHGVEDIA